MSTETKTPPPSPQSTLGEPKPIPPIPDAQARLRAIAEKQGTLGRATFDNLLGAGAHLWESEVEFDQFLEHVNEVRRAKE